MTMLVTVVMPTVTACTDEVTMVMAIYPAVVVVVVAAARHVAVVAPVVVLFLVPVNWQPPVATELEVPSTEPHLGTQEVSPSADISGHRETTSV